MPTCALCARPSVRSYFHALYVSSFLIKKRQVRVWDPVLFMLPRSPPVRGRRRLTTIQNKFYLNGLAPLVHPGITEYFSAQEAEMAVEIPSFFPTRVTPRRYKTQYQNANSPHWFKCSFPKELEFDKRSKHDVIILLILITFSLDCVLTLMEENWCRLLFRTQRVKCKKSADMKKEK